LPSWFTVPVLGFSLLLQTQLGQDFELLQLPAATLAAQLTTFEFNIFRQITADELLNQRWKKDSKSTVAPNVTAMIEQFNRVRTTFARCQGLILIEVQQRAGWLLGGHGDCASQKPQRAVEDRKEIHTGRGWYCLHTPRNSDQGTNQVERAF